MMSRLVMSNWRSFGAHESRITDDLMELRVSATIDEKDVAEISRMAAEILQRYPRLFLLIDASQVGWLTPAARRYTAEWRRTHPNDSIASAIYGASSTVRALATLLSAAVRIMGGRAMPNFFVKTEEEGRALLAKLRSEPSSLRQE